MRTILVTLGIGFQCMYMNVRVYKEEKEIKGPKEIHRRLYEPFCFIDCS